MDKRSKEQNEEEALKANFESFVPDQHFEDKYKEHLIEHPDTTREEFYHNVYLPFD